MQENKKLLLAARIKAFGFALVGAGMAGQGSTYFAPKLSYDVPRILYPVYTTLGHKGLAVSMLLLGALLLGWSFYTWKSIGSKALYWVLMPGLLSIVLFTALFVFQKKDQGSTLQDMLDRNERQVKTVGAGNPGNAPVIAGAAAEDDIVFPATVTEEQKKIFRQMRGRMDITIQAGSAAAARSAYNRLNVYAARELQLGGKDEAHLQFNRQFTAMMEAYGLRIKALE